MVLLKGRRRWQGQAKKDEVDGGRVSGKPQKMLGSSSTRVVFSQSPELRVDVSAPTNSRRWLR